MRSSLSLFFFASSNDYSPVYTVGLTLIIHEVGSACKSDERVSYKQILKNYEMRVPADFCLTADGAGVTKDLDAM